MGIASIKTLSSGAVHIVMPGDLLFSGSDGFRLSRVGRSLLDRLVPALVSLKADSCIRVICHGIRPSGQPLVQGFVDCWKQTNWCSSHVVKHFLWKRELKSLTFKAEGRSCAEPLVEQEPPLSARNWRLVIQVEPCGVM